METIQLTQPIWANTTWDVNRSQDRPLMEWTGTSAASALIDIPCVIAAPEGTLLRSPQPDLWRVSSRQHQPSDRFLPVSVVAGLTLVTAVGILDYATQAPTYEAQVQLAVPVAGQTQLDVQTQIEVMESPLLLEPVVNQLRRQSADFPVDLSYDSLLQSLSIEAQGESFDIRYRHPDADVAETVIEALSAAYLDYGQNCRQSDCRGLNYINAQLPHLQQQVQAKQAALRQMHTNALNPDQQVKLLTARTLDARRQTIDLKQRLAGARRDRDILQEKLGLSANSPVTTLLQRDVPYQQQLQALRKVEQQIAVEFGRVQSDSTALRALYQQHSAIASQLHQEAHWGLRRFLANPRGPVDPVFQQPLYGELLLKLIGIVHQVEVLELRQKTIVQAEAILAEEMDRVASLLRRYTALQQELLSSTRILSTYVDRRSQLQESEAWQVVSPPQVTTVERFDWPDWPTGLPRSAGYYAGAIAGVGAIAAALVTARRQKVIEGELV